MYKTNNVYTAVWVATTILAYHKYQLIKDKTEISLNSFFFRQKDIRDIAVQICSKKVHSARVSQWCNGDHRNNYYDYLRQDSGTKQRRLSKNREFDSGKERPLNLPNTEEIRIMIKDRSHTYSFSEIMIWIKNFYDNL